MPGKPATRCAHSLRLYNDEWDKQSNLIEFLADARHWCDREGLSFAKLDRIACQRYIAEREDVPAGSRPTPFDAYEIHGVAEENGTCEIVGDDEAQFWSLYGHIPGQGVECIGDFETRERAEEIYARITGQPYATQTSKGVQS